MLVIGVSDCLFMIVLLGFAWLLVDPGVGFGSCGCVCDR